MTAATEEATAVSELSEEEYEAALERVRDFKTQLDRAGRMSDKDTLARAADLESLYLDPRWSDPTRPDGHPAPKKESTDSRSLNRFCDWAMNRTGIHAAHVRRLHVAYVTVSTLPVGSVLPTGENALRPFSRLRNRGYEARIPQVYKRAVELSEGQPPTSAEVKQAVDEFLAPIGRTKQQQLVAAEKAKARADRLRAQFINLLGADAELAGLTLNSLIDLYNEKVNK